MKPRVYVFLSVCFLLASGILVRTTRPSLRASLALADSTFPAMSEHRSKLPAKSSPNQSGANLVNSYGRLPLSFEANRGQTDPQVKFVARGQGYTLFLTRRAETVLVLRKPAPQRDLLKPAALVSVPATLNPDAAGPPAIVRMKLVGANAKPRAEALDELPGKANYFIGNDPKKWRTNVPLYAKVRYRDVYPGVDLMYYGNQRQLEHDFIVAPGADPRSITLNLAGAEKLSLDPQGALVLVVKDGELRLDKPHIYQDVDGARREISGGYVLKNAHRVGFQVAAYDASRPLVIDPTLFYSTYLGGSSNEHGLGIAVDAAGNACVTGYTLSTNFPTTSGAIQSANQGGYDAFVTKLNPAGSAPLVYSTYLGGGSDEQGLGIAVDAAGNAYVTGYTQSTNFPTTSGAFQTANQGLVDAFVTKLNPTGTAPLVYSTYLGGNDQEQGDGIAVDATGNAYVTGYTQSTNFPTTPGAFQTANQGGYDAFVTKLNPTGSAPLVYSTYLGGSDLDQGRGIAVDAAGNAYVAGYTQSTNFPTTSGAFQPAPAGGLTDAFVTKLNPTGSAPLVYSTYLGGSSGDAGFGIAVDSIGNAYVTGFTHSTNFPTTAGAIQSANQGGYDAFVTALNPLGTAPLIYSTYLGGSSDEIGHGIAVDAGNAYVTGDTESTNFPTTPGAFQTANGGLSDAFAAKITGLPFAFATGNGAAFVIGDLEAGLGNHVTWWSSQWAKINLMSGGAPPNAMKGFAGFEDNFLGLPPPNCGGTWSTDPGNSTPPPPSVPKFMGVIVSSMVTQSGSIISGNIKQVVVVQTDPGYAPNPGNPGTGTEIAIVCAVP
jgi:hypothetical protein